MLKRLLYVFLAITIPAQAADIEAGKAKSAVCAACHGADGNSLNPAWPKLAGQHAPYLIAQLKAFQANKGRSDPLMSSQAQSLTPEEIDNLAAYFSSQKIQPGEADPSRVAQGQKLYQGGQVATQLPACIACHGPTGHGNALAGFPLIGGQQADYVIKQLNDYKSGARQNAMMSPIAHKLSDEDIKNLAAYLSGLH